MGIRIIAMVTMIVVMTNPIGPTGLIVQTDQIGPIDPLIYPPNLIALRINPEEVWGDLRVGVKSVVSSVISDTSRW